MSFDLENDKLDNKKQLSLFDFQMTQKDFVASNSSAPKASPSSRYDSTAADLNNWLFAHSEPEQSKTPRFVTLSAAVHLVAILATALVTVPIVEQAKTETITIEIEDVPVRIKQPRGVKVPATKGGTPITKTTPIVQKLEDAGSPGDIVVAKQKTQTKQAAVTALPAKISKSVSAAKAAPSPAPKSSAHGMSAKTTFKAVPLSIDDIEAPELEQGDLAKATVASNLDEDFDDDFTKINQSRKGVIDDERKSLESMAAALEAEQNENLNTLDEANKEEQSRLAAIQNSARQKNAQSIASALAAEKAAVAAAMAREAKAKEAAAKRGGLGGEGNGLGMKNGDGAGNSGHPGHGTQIAGLPSGVRSLDQLRQMPGNLRPQYDREERRRGDQGEIAFIAYISKEGHPTKFRLMKSTGFRNLDAKTLGALKKWRFYPGQEGWVELPFRWDIKGGVQQDGGLLRRSITHR